MPVNYVNFVGETSFDGASFVADNKVYLRSDAAADDEDFVIAGLKNSDSSAVSETLTSATNGGKIERLSTDSLKEFHYFSNRSSGTETALGGTVQIRLNNGTAATGSITVLSQPADGSTLTIGLSGFTKVFTFRTTTVSANGDIYSDSDLTKTASNIASAINDSSTGTPTAGEGSGGTYGWYNTDDANPYLTATVSGSTVNLSDKINGKRSLSWVVTPYTASDFAICSIRGGIDGTLIGSISAGLKSASTSATEGITLQSEAQTANTLPGGFTGTSVGVATRGKFVVDIRTGTPNGAVNAAIQVSNDNVNFRNVPTTTITNLASDQDQQLVGDDLFAEYARLNITSNAATSGTVANIAFISQG
jgi:hypothetical protein